MKTLLYTFLLTTLTLITSCQSQWECYNDEPMYYVVCINNGDTVTYYASAIMGQSVEAKKYYQDLGYSCVDTLTNWGNVPWRKVYTDREVKQLENIGYKCRSIGP